TYGTSEAFLSHFGLDAVGDLPGLEELKGSGLLDGRLPPGFSVPMPSDDPALHDDEDPLEPGDLDLGLAPPPERTGEGGGARVGACGTPRCGARAGTRLIELTRRNAAELCGSHGLKAQIAAARQRMRAGEVLVFAARGA